MSRVFGFVGLLIVMGVGLFIYKQQIQSTSAPGGAAANPRATVDIVGVQNDLTAIANAERRRYALDGKYTSIDDLISNGDISMQKPSRGEFTYSSDVTEDGFLITATYNGNEPTVPKTLTIDQNMHFGQ